MQQFLVSLISYVVLLAAPVAAPQQDPHAGTSAAGVDFTQCSTCHEDRVTGMQHTRHAALAGSCGNCHTGNFQEHMDTGDPVHMTAPHEMTARQVSQTCRSCHDKNIHQANWQGSIHERRGLSCISCHSIHNFKSTSHQLKTVRESDTCNGCHTNIRAQTLRQSHHPIREGKMECGSCHNPHGSNTPKMIKAASINEQCYTCHTEKRGPFLWEHAPVRENCTLCHNPHGSNSERLLVAKQPYLCQRCHLNTRHPGTLYDFRNTVAGPNPSNRLIEHGCRNCHQNIHGTNHPSGAYLGR